MLNTVLGALSSDIAVDLGSAHTRIHVRGRGLVCCEPTVLAVQEDRAGRRNVVAYGAEAAAMEGRTPAHIQVMRPVVGGVIEDYELAEALLAQLVMEVQGRRLWVGPRAAVCVPHGITEVERRALRECAEASGARDVRLVDGAVAAALGVGLPFDEPHGQMLVDVGAGVTEMAVLSLGGVVYSRALSVGGRHLDLAIQRYLREHHQLHVGLGMAEAIKCAVGGARPVSQEQGVRARGRRADTGFPGEVVVRGSSVVDAVAEQVRQIVEAVVSTLERTPPDLAADIAGTGIVLTGGGALLRDLDRAIGEATGLPVIVPEDPFASSVAGAAAWMSGPRLQRAAAG